MLVKLLNKLGLYTSSGYQEGHDLGYEQGLAEGRDFGHRVAYNRILSKEINHIISRYGRLQLKLLQKNAPKDVMQAEFAKFLNDEIDRFKMEMQDR